MLKGNLLFNGSITMDSNETKDMQRLLAMDITEIEFPIHICNLLSNCNFNTVGDLINASESELKKRFRERRFAIIKEKIVQLGLKFKE